MNEDELYGLPLGDFVAARDALAASRKAAGDKAGASAIKKLARPSVAAWAANQIVRWGRREYERLQAAAGALRELQARSAPAQELRDALRERNQALAACEQRAAQLLADAGHAAGPAVLQRVSHTLLALAHGAADARPGCLTTELEPPGFDALPALAPVVRDPPAPTPAVMPEPSATPAPATPAAAAVDDDERLARQQAEAEARRLKLQRDVEAARTALGHSETRLSAHEAHLQDAEKRLAAARELVQQARAEAAASRARLDAAEQALARLPQA